jgi:hypothetical protein
MRIDQQHRGRKLGLQICAATMALAVEHGANFCTVKPFPLQWEGCYDHDSDERNEQAEQDFKRLTQYYKTLGFHDSQSSQGIYWLEIKTGTNIFGFNADNWKLKKSGGRKKSNSPTDFESKFA